MEKKFSRQKSGWYLLFIYPQLAFYTPRVTGERRGSEQNKNDVNLVNPNVNTFAQLCFVGSKLLHIHPSYVSLDSNIIQGIIARVEI